MNILSELTLLLTAYAPVETGVFSGEASDEYFVITPLTDSFELYGDNRPEFETQEARISVYSKISYLTLKNSVVSALLNGAFMVTDRRHIGREDDTGYFHYAIDIAKLYTVEVE